MLIELKTVKLTKSKILQMEYISVPIDPNIEVLGWVNLDKKRYIIIKRMGNFCRTSFITKVEKEVKGVQFPLADDGYEFPHLHNIKYETHNGRTINLPVERDDKKNIDNYNLLISFKRKTEKAGQVYY